MPIVRCRMTDCVNWDEGYCSAARINIDDEGVCLTYSTLDDWLRRSSKSRNGNRRKKMGRRKTWPG